MKKPIFALIPSGFKASKLYTPIPINGEGDFTTTRTSVAHRMNKEGYLEEVAASVPRLDYSDSKCPSLLLEEAATNLMPYSEDFTLGWSNVNILDTANAVISPDGNLNGTKLERTVTVASYSTQTFSKSATAIQYTSSIFVKQGNTPYFAVRSQGLSPARVDLRFNFATKSFYYANANTFTDLTYTVEEYPNGWFRLQWTYITDTHTSLAGIYMSPKHLDGNIDNADLDYGYCYVWGAQTEENAVATSYIKTTLSSASRNKENCNGSGDLTLWNNLNKEGSWYFNIKPINDGVQLKSISIADSTLASRILLRQDDDYTYRFYLLVGGVAKATLTANLDQALEWHKIAVRWKQDNVQIFLNGIEVATDTTVDLAGALDYDEFAFDNGGGSQQWTGSVKEAMIWDEYLTDEELIGITTL